MDGITETEFLDLICMEESVPMKRYIAFLRGINISGKNKISMAELKKGFEELGFQEVKTYLNSGNVIFSSEKDEKIGRASCRERV